MIKHPVRSSSAARLVAVLAVGLGFVVLFASSAIRLANADSSQWVISQPESWSGWHRQPWNWNSPNGDAHANTQHWSMQQWGQGGGGSFHHGDDFHHDNHDHFDGHGFVIVNPIFPGSAIPPAFGFVTPSFMGSPPPFIVTQPGFIIGQPFVPGQPHFFVDPHFVHKQVEFVERHPSLGRPVVIGQPFVIATGGHSIGIPRMHGMHSSGTVIRSGMHSGMH